MKLIDRYEEVKNYILMLGGEVEDPGGLFEGCKLGEKDHRVHFYYDSENNYSDDEEYKYVAFNCVIDKNEYIFTIKSENKLDLKKIIDAFIKNDIKYLNELCELYG